MDDEQDKREPHHTQNQRAPARPIVRRVRVKAEVWERALAEYFAGATAAEVAARHGVSAHSIYQRVRGRGKWQSERQSGVGRRQSDPKGSPPARWGRWTRTQCAAGGGGASLSQEAPPEASSESPADATPSVSSLRSLPAPPSRGSRDFAERRVRIRRHHAPEIWAQARRDYEVGKFTAPAIAQYYKMTEHAVKRRARVEKWSKTVRAAPPPLLIG